MDLPHIFLAPDKIDADPPKPLYVITDEPPKKPSYNEQIISENISKAVLDIEEFEKDQPIFLFIKLNKCNPWSSRAKNALNKLGLSIVRIFTEDFIIVKTESEKISALKEKLNKMHEYVKETIIDIGKWSGFDKIFSELREVALQNKEHYPTFSVVLSTFENIPTTEREKLRAGLEKELLNDNITFHYNEDFMTYHCEMKSDMISKYGKFTFIENIRPTTNFFTSSDIKDIKYSRSSQINVAAIKENELSPICVIDSGVSEFDSTAENLIKRKSLFGDSGEDNAEDGGHGTKVASVAMFGQDLLNGGLFLTPKARIISHKVISGDNKNTKTIDFLIALRDVITESLPEDPVFNMSVNFSASKEYRVSFADPSDYFIYTDLANKIDRFIREKNALFVNSVGNIPPFIIEKERNNSPHYLCQNHVFFPSFARNIVSVGSYYGKNEITSYTRLGAPFENSYFGSIEKNFLAPVVLAFGGEKTEKENCQVRCINNSGEIKESYGTSIAAPLVSLALRVIHDKQPELKNAEGVKAALLNSCDRKTVMGKKFFFISDLNSIGKCGENIYFNFEAEINPIFPDYKNHQTLLPFANFRFYMPKGANKIEFVLVNSSSHPFESCDKGLFRPDIRVKRAGGGGLKNKDFEQSNLESFERIHFGEFTFAQAGENFWDFKVRYEHKSPVPEVARIVKVRFGLSIRVSFKDASDAFLEKAYNTIIERHKLRIEATKLKPIYNMVTSAVK